MNRCDRCFFNKKKESRRGFTIFFTFLCILTIISAVLFSHSFELESVARVQKRLIAKEGYVRPAIDPRLNHLLPEAAYTK